MEQAAVEVRLNGLSARSIVLAASAHNHLTVGTAIQQGAEVRALLVQALLSCGTSSLASGSTSKLCFILLQCWRTLVGGRATAAPLIHLVHLSLLLSTCFACLPLLYAPASA